VNSLPRTALLALSVLALIAAHAGAYPITIDGLPDDWGIDPGPFASSDWEPNPGVDGVWGPPEDYQPGTDGGYVHPGYGGQQFDAEAFYCTYDPEFAYFGLVIGLPPQGAQGHVPGDIALDFGPDGTWDIGIETTGNNGNAPGGLYASILWGSGLWGNSDPTSILTGSLQWEAGGTNIVYSALAGTDHYFVEVAVPLEQFPLSETTATAFRAHWTQTCGNDAVDFDSELPSVPTIGGVVPEPATCAILGGSLLAMGALRRRKSRKARSRRAA